MAMIFCDVFIYIFLEDVETQQPNKFLGPTSLVKDKYLEYLQA